MLRTRTLIHAARSAPEAKNHLRQKTFPPPRSANAVLEKIVARCVTFRAAPPERWRKTLGWRDRAARRCSLTIGIGIAGFSQSWRRAIEPRSAFTPQNASFYNVFKNRLNRNCSLRLTCEARSKALSCAPQRSAAHSKSGLTKQTHSLLSTDTRLARNGPVFAEAAAGRVNSAADAGEGA